MLLVLAGVCFWPEYFWLENALAGVWVWLEDALGWSAFGWSVLLAAITLPWVSLLCDLLELGRDWQPFGRALVVPPLNSGSKRTGRLKQPCFVPAYSFKLRNPALLV